MQQPLPMGTNSGSACRLFSRGRVGPRPPLGLWSAMPPDSVSPDGAPCGYALARPTPQRARELRFAARGARCATTGVRIATKLGPSVQGCSGATKWTQPRTRRGGSVLRHTRSDLRHNGSDLRHTGPLGAEMSWITRSPTRDLIRNRHDGSMLRQTGSDLRQSGSDLRHAGSELKQLMSVGAEVGWITHAGPTS